MTTIKLEKALLIRFEDLAHETAKVRDIMGEIQREEMKLWNALKKKYPDCNFVGAEIDWKEETLILPFEETPQKPTKIR